MNNEDFEDMMDNINEAIPPYDDRGLSIEYLVAEFIDIWQLPSGRHFVDLSQLPADRPVFYIDSDGGVPYLYDPATNDGLLLTPKFVREHGFTCNSPVIS
jgi:hypothetical protein